MNIEDIIGKKIAVRCRTKEDAELFFKKVRQKGCLWYGGYEITEDTFWCSDSDCYEINKFNRLTHGGFIFYEDAGYEIIDSLAFA